MKKKFITVFIVLAIFPVALGWAQRVPADLQVALFYKIFDFDESLADISGNQIVIGVFYNPDDERSQQAKDEIMQAFFQVSERTVAGKKVIIKEITAVDQLKGINILYVAPGSDVSIKQIVKKCEMEKIFGIAATEEYARQGLPLAVGVENNKPKIVVNRSAAQSCGVKLSSKLLALSQLI